MKILAIRGNNMASLAGEFEIDFRSEPLKSAGIFAITGNTGSGKSTLLDTMCIALYNKSPRTENVNGSTEFPDTGKKGIHESDTRNILRRGCVEGYAECDFRAIDGKEYRARWSVHRANHKPDGNLKNSECSLHCLSNNSDIQGTKTELYKKISNLLGLTFDQFTRAVLLAQGDFATFLKAPSAKKSEILEKLTGTDIYSQISKKIFLRNKEAENELKIISAKIGEIKLLSDDEITALDDEHKQIEKEKKESEKNLKESEKKLEWIERMSTLEAEEKSARESVARSQKALDELRPTIEALKKIDSIQPIRDTYTNILALKKEIKESNEKIEEQKSQEKAQAEALSRAEAQLKTLINQQTILSNEWNAAQPKIREALKIETEKRINTQKLSEHQQEINNSKKQQTQCSTTIEHLTQENATLQKELQTILEWKKAHEKHNSVANSIDTTLQDITEADEASMLIKEKSKLRETSQALLKNQENRLAEAQALSEHLNSTLTQEIATLRSQLVEGKPCPVCGSRHHETSTIGNNILQEKQLIKAKEENRATIEHLSKSIEHSRTEITTLAASIEGYTKIYNNKYSRATRQLQPLLHTDSPTLQELITLAREVKNIATEWQRKETQYSDTQRKREINNATLSATQTRLKEITESIDEKESNLKRITQSIEQQDKKHSQLIGNNSAQSLEQEYQKKIQRVNDAITQGSEHRNTLLVTLARSRQHIETLHRNIQQKSHEFQEHKQAIEKFLASCTPALSLEELHKIATTPAQEITRMRNLVEQTNNQLLQATTTLDERRRNIEQHLKAPTRPDASQSKEELQSRHTENREKVSQLSERLTQITVTLKSDDANKKHTQKLRQELDKATETATAWKKLDELLGSSDGNKFRMIAQGYTLDIMLTYANKHLAELSSRYKLGRISPETLAIKVIDLDMMSQSRSVHTLSGGETFLVSLALALALSSLSSNKMNIESLFIDEGFGSLDSETLSIAMDALERLHNMGRKIGIISHLSEIIERIPTQIHVIKSKEGKSKIKIIG